MTESLKPPRTGRTQEADVPSTRRSLRIVEAGEARPDAGARLPRTGALAAAGRRAFVGRQRELQQLEAAFESAVAGRGALVTVLGEPGIGKTALCRQLAAHALSRGGLVLEGSCYEEGSLALPYLPFVEALRSHARVCEPAILRSDLGTHAGFVACIVPEVRERLGIDEPSPESSEEDRWRLFEAVSSFVFSIARRQPLVLLLEDLHWADRGTRDLLRYLARALGDSRLLVVATYRDAEVDRTHPLSGALADLRRIEDFARVHLHGLDVDEVQEMLRDAAGPAVPRGLGEHIHRQTEGNPLFVEEVLRHLAEEGVLRAWDGRSAEAARVLAESVPEGLHDVIGKRISRLSPECNRLLAVAAVIGRDFAFEVLESLARLPEEVVLGAIEEAARAGVLEERVESGEIHYRFTHAFYRQVLYEEMLAPRRLRLHQEVARAIESRYASRLDDHAAELAEHFSHSPDPGDLAKAIEHCERAARRATAVFDYGEAQRLLKRALAVLDVLDPTDVARKSTLRISLAHALNAAGDQAAARALALEVADTARAAGDTGHLIAATRLLADQAGLIGSTDAPRAALLREVLQVLPPGPSADRAWCLARLGHYLAFFERDVRLGATLVEQGLEMARTVGDPRLVAQVARSRVGLYWEQATPDIAGHHRAIRALVDGVESLGIRDSVDTAFFLIYPRLGVAFAEGDIAEAERRVAEMEAFAARHRSIALVWNALTSRIALLVLEGRLAEARALADSPLPGAFITGLGADYATFRGDIGVFLNIAIGRAAGEERAIMRFSRLPAARVFLAWAFLRTGEIARATEVLNQLNQFIEIERAGATRSWALLLECVARLSPKETVADVYRAVLPHSGFNVGGTNKPSPESFGPADRYLGLLATALGRLDDAERHYLAAIEQCERMPSPTFLGESRYNYAEMLLKRDAPGDRAKAGQILTQTIAGAREIGHQWLVEHATALQSEAPGGSTRQPMYPGGLSGREAEVLRLVAAGKTNPEIAEALTISRYTVTRHVSNLFDKLGVRHRSDAAAWAVRNGLAE